MSDLLPPCPHYRRREWMQMCKGLPAYKVVQILNRFGSGDWTRCNKSQMAEAWIANDRIKDRDGLRQALEAAPRETPAARRCKQAKRNLAKRLRQLRSMMEIALEDTEGTDWLAQKMVDTGAAAEEIRMLYYEWLEEGRRLEKKIEGIRKKQSYLVQLEMAAKRALGMKQ